MTGTVVTFMRGCARSLAFIAAIVAIQPAAATPVDSIADPALEPAAPRPSPHAIDIPPWFTEGFLDFREETRDAARQGKQLLIYIGQDGCPYCRELMVNNFSQKAIVDKTRQHFNAIALNLWGDRETTWVDGRVMSEKQLAKALKVQFTPTLLFVDGSGQVVTRLNGYQTPWRLSAVLDYVSARLDRQQLLGEYLAARADPRANPLGEARARLTDEPFFVKPPHDLRRRPGGKPLAVLFETRHCQPCDEMHDLGLQRPEVRAQIQRLDVARFALGDAMALTGPTGQALQANAWARQLGISYTPTLVFFDDRGAEVFRVDGYTRPFHLATAFEYVASGAYRQQPEFQRYIQTRADALRARGVQVDLWR